MPAAWLQIFAACWVAGFGRHLDRLKKAPRGIKPRGRSGFIFARSVTCGPDQPAPSHHFHVACKPWSTGQHVIESQWGVGERNNRKPLLLLRLSGLFLLRLAARALCGLLFQAPPRSTGVRCQATRPDNIRHPHYKTARPSGRAPGAQWITMGANATTETRGSGYGGQD